MLIGMLALVGCAGSSMEKRQVRSSKRAPAAAGPDRSVAQEAGGLRDYVDKPGVLVARLGTRWGLRLSEIKKTQHRRWVARDLLELELRRRKYKLPPPERSMLFVAGPGLYSVLVLPAVFDPRGQKRIDVHVWDYTAARQPVRLALSAPPGGRLEPVGHVVKVGARRDHVFLLRPERVGSFRVSLTLSRVRKVLLERMVQAVAERPRLERP